MLKKLNKIKSELYQIKKAFVTYHSGLTYCMNRFVRVKDILKIGKIDQPANQNNLSVHVLTGKKDFFMSLWSLASFYKHTSVRGSLYIHSDGTLGNYEQNVLHEVLPESTLVTPEEFETLCGEELRSYPILYSFRFESSRYVLLKKLIDPFFVSNKMYHLIIDGDLVWYSSPTEIEHEIVTGGLRSFMSVGDAPNRTHTIVYKDGGGLPENKLHVNSGIVLYRRDFLDLERISDYFSRLDTSNRVNDHFIEQGAYALSLRNLAELPYARYTIKGTVQDGVVCKHYTGPRRSLFYIEGMQSLRRSLFL